MRKIKEIIRSFIPESFILRLWHFPRAYLVALWYGFPGRRLTVIAVSGTKGKTTTAYVIAELLRQAGHITALMTTAAVRIGDDEKMNMYKMTSPSPWTLQKFLLEAVRKQAVYAVIEVSSHALMQYRLAGIPIRYAVVTNLASDHLEYHRDTREYQEIHRRLISPFLKALVINGDDPNTELLRGKTKKEHIYTMDGEVATKLKALTLSLPGEYNFSNCLAAASLADILQMPWSIIERTLTNPITVPGRFETIDAGNGISVIVDYAHSPESLTAFFGALRSIHKKKIISVFGACGERDAKQRPLMGEVLDKESSVVIITNDDPYGEDPEAIAAGLLEGIQHKVNGETLYKILDRRAAITQALDIAQSGDIVLILGKGAEQFQVFADERKPWDDRTVVREVIARKALPVG